jgi:hypothetical protein
MGGLAGLASMKHIKANCCLIIAFTSIVGLLTPPLSLPLFCALVGMSFFSFSDSTRLRRTLRISAFFVGFQFLCQVAYNQWMTGLMMETPIRLAWALSNPQKIKQYFDPYLVQYLILGSSKGLGGIALSNLYSSLGSIFDLFKTRDMANVLGAPLFAATLVMAVLNYKAYSLKGIKSSPAALFIFIMILFTCAFGLLTGQTKSLGRILSFASLSISLYLSAGLFFTLSKISYNKKTGMRLLPVCLVIILVSQIKINTEVSFASKTSDVLGWLSGKTQTWDLSKGINPAAESWAKLKKIIRLSDKIFCLNIISGPENVTQGRYVKSEVSHSFGPNWGKMVFGTPKDSQSVLDKYNIKYIAVEKCGFMFGAFPFSEYFTSWKMSEQKADIVYEDDFLLCVKTRSINDSQEETENLLKTINSPRSMGQYIMNIQRPEYRSASIKMETLRNVLLQIWTANNAGVPIHIEGELPKDMGWQ